MAPPTGLSLSKIHEIGHKLGEGAFGEVYAVKGSIDNVKWAVKVVPIPAKATKKQNSLPELVCSRLFHEYLVYTNCRKWSGSLLPRLPSRRSDKIDMYYENLGGFRCLVMEQLQGPLFDSLDPLVRSSSQYVELGKTACKLIDILEAMHGLSYVLIDIKPENFMVSSGLGEKVTDDSLAANLRLIDLGLAKALSGVGGHVENDGLKGLAGNALYASLNIHAMDTPSRRDDVQSVLFMIGEMILTIQAIDLGKAAPYGKGDRASHLPWSQEKSDEAVGETKMLQVLNKDSEFFSQMPSEAAETIFNCITKVVSYTYKQKPLYDRLREDLASLKVPRTSNRKPAPRSSKTTRSTKTPPPRRSPLKPDGSDRTSRNGSSVMEDHQETDTKRSSKSARLRSIHGDHDEVREESDDDVENPTNVADANLLVKGRGLYCKQADLWIVLSKETGIQNVVVGKRPTKKGATAADLLVLKDSSLEPSHVTLSLVSGAVCVKPHKASTVFVNGGTVPLSGTCATVGQRVEFGDYVFEVHSLPLKTRSNVTNNGRTTKQTRDKCRRRAFLEIVAGSLKGNRYELIRGNREVIVMGSSPSGDGFLVTLDEKGVSANHVRFELSEHQSNGTIVNVHDVGRQRIHVNGEIVTKDMMIGIAKDSVIKISNDAQVSVTFVHDS